MTQTVKYREIDESWSVTLTTRRPEDTELEDSAEGQAGIGKVIVDDDNADVGHDGDSVRGLKKLTVDESAAPVGDRRVWTGYVGPRDYKRSKNYGTVGPNAREIAITAVEQTTTLGDLVVHGSGAAGGRRPRESAGTRLLWLLASGFINCEDRGKVVYPSVMMDGNDYRGQRGGDVLADIQAVTGYDAKLLQDDEAETVPELFFDDFDHSTVYTTTKKISNAGDDDSATIFAPLDPDGEEGLHRSPDNVSSGGFGAFGKGNVFREKAATAAKYRPRDMTISTSQAKTREQAIRIVDKQLTEHGDEDDTVNVSVLVAPAQVNFFRAAHRVEAQLTYAPDWESYRWARIRSRRITQPAGHDFKYRLDLALSPMAGDICEDAEELLQDHATILGAIGVESGSSVWAHATISGWFGLPLDDSVTLLPVVDVASANDGDPATYSYITGAQLRNDGTVAAYWVAELEATYSICRLKGTNAVGSSAWQSYPPDRIEYWDGSAWVVIGGTYLYTAAIPSPQYWQRDLPEAIETDKLRFVYVQTGVGTIFGLWNWMVAGVRVYDLQAFGVAV